MSDSTESSAYFYRIITLVIDVGTETLRDILYSKVEKANVATLFSSRQTMDEFKRLKRKHVLSDVQFENVTVNPDPDKYDITLLLILLTNQKICGVSSPTNGWKNSPDPADDSLGADLIRIRELRNKLVGHRPNTQVALSDFKNFWGEVEAILVRLAGSISPAEEDKIKRKINDAETRVLEPLDDREKKLLQVFLQWQEEKDKKNQAELTEVQNSLESLHLKFDNIGKSSTSTDETDAVRSEDTLSSLQSQVLSIADSMGGMAQQGAVQEIHQNVENMQDVMNRLIQTVQTLQKQLDDKREENKLFVEEIKQLKHASGNRGTSVIYQRQTKPRPKITNPNAMSEKEIFDLSRQIGYEWEQLRIHLDFTQAQLYALKKAYNDDAQQRIHVMLKAWHDVVAECGENPKLLLAAAFVNASTNYSMAYKLVSRENFDANATAKQSTVERIEQITFCKSGHYSDQGDGYHQSGKNSPFNYGGHGAVNVYGGDVRIEGSLAIHSSSPSSTSLVSSDGQGGPDASSLPHSGSFNVYDGKVVVGAGSSVVIGPPGSSGPSQSLTSGVRGERLDVTDSVTSLLGSSGVSGQPFKKEFDDTLSQTMVAALNEQMKSVGVLISHGDTIGTVFRVGTKCVMTALHVVRHVIDPTKSGDADFTRLESDDTYINFNESAIVPPVVQYRMKKELIFNQDLDVAVLEISNPSNLPLKMNLHKPTVLETTGTNVSLIGYGHTIHTKKCLDPKCKILSPNSQRIKAALASLQQKFGYFKSAMTAASQNPDLVDSGYHGYDYPTKILFDCFMEHGGSGAPALTNNNERTVEVVGMLTHGLPEFYFKLPDELRANFPKEYRFELGSKMSCIYDWIKATQTEQLVKDLFN